MQRFSPLIALALLITLAKSVSFESDDDRANIREMYRRMRIGTPPLDKGQLLELDLKADDVNSPSRLW